MANYNIWANGRLYSACGSLGAEAYLKERPSFFGSIHKTLNHILVGDMIWMDRFLGEQVAPKTLDAVLFEDFEGLYQARKRQDEKILDFAISLTDERLGEILEYTDIEGEPHDVPISICIGHLFNHQTHHRGQVHCLLSSETKNPPPLDLIYFTLEKLEGQNG